MTYIYIYISYSVYLARRTFRWHVNLMKFKLLCTRDIAKAAAVGANNNIVTKKCGGGGVQGASKLRDRKISVLRRHRSPATFTMLRTRRRGPHTAPS